MIQTETAVIGAGIAGLTVAESLIRIGKTVTVVDAKRAGSGTSRNAAGMLAPLVEAHASEQVLLAFGRDALGYWKEWICNTSDPGEIAHSATGTLLVATEPDHVGALEHLASVYRRLHLPIEEISTAEAKRREPLLAPGIGAAYYSAEDVQVDPRRLLASLVRTVTDSPLGELLENSAVDLITIDRSGRFLFDAGENSLAADNVVLALGARMRQLTVHDASGDPHPGVSAVLRSVRPVTGDILRLDRRAQGPVSHTIRTPECYLVPKPGELLVGASSEDRGYDPTNRAGAVYELLRYGRETVPAIDEMPLVELEVGHRPATPDHLPILGPAGIDRLWVAGGYYRHGILFAPLAAELLARYIDRDEYDERLSHFDPRRCGRDTGQR